MTMGKPTRALIAATALLVLAACGGSKDDGPPADLPASRAEAARFLTQATFGPTPAEVDRVMTLGYSAWIDDQLADWAARSALDVDVVKRSLASLL